MPEPPLACLQSLTQTTFTDQHDAHFAANTAKWNISIDDIAHLLSVPMCDIRYPRWLLILENKYPQNCSRFWRQFRLLSLLQVHQPIPYSLQGPAPVKIDQIPRHHSHYHATTARSHAVLAASATAAATGCSSPEWGAAVSQANSLPPMRLRQEGQPGISWWILTKLLQNETQMGCPAVDEGQPGTLLFIRFHALKRKRLQAQSGCISLWMTSQETVTRKMLPSQTTHGNLILTSAPARHELHPRSHGPFLLSMVFPRKLHSWRNPTSSQRLSSATLIPHQSHILPSRKFQILISSLLNIFWIDAPIPIATI